MSTRNQNNRRGPKRPRRSFTPEFKASAGRMLLEERKSIRQVAKDLDLTETAFRQWVERAKADQAFGKPGVLITTKREELTKPQGEPRTADGA